MDMSAAGLALSELLEPIAAFFRTLNIPAPITHWGHPAMMGTVVVALGSAVGFAGWAGRLGKDEEKKQTNLSNHALWAKLMFGFMALGYTGGVLSLVMQQESVLQSPHFWTGSVVLALLFTNSMLSKFFGAGADLRKAHAYLGSSTLGLMLVHGLLGLKLGLSF